jgi:hypothetical protein
VLKGCLLRRAGASCLGPRHIEARRLDESDLIPEELYEIVGNVAKET